MAIDPAQMIELVRGLVDADPRQRWEHAGTVTDLRSEMSPADGHTIASLLAALAVWDLDPLARESQLHALADLHEWGMTSSDAIDLLARLDLLSLAGSEVEYVQFLRGDGES